MCGYCNTPDTEDPEQVPDARVLVLVGLLEPSRAQRPGPCLRYPLASDGRCRPSASWEVVGGREGSSRPWPPRLGFLELMSRELRE